MELDLRGRRTTSLAPRSNKSIVLVLVLAIGSSCPRKHSPLRTLDDLPQRSIHTSTNFETLVFLADSWKFHFGMFKKLLTTSNVLSLLTDVNV